MTRGEFLDESIIRYTVEQNRVYKEQLEQMGENDISNGYAYINGERMTFSIYSLPGEKLFALIPDVFIEERTPMVTEWMAELCNYDGSVSLFFEIPQKLTDAQLSVSFNYRESWNITKNDGESRYYLDFEDTQISGTFSCAEYRLEDWKEILHQIMYSVTGNIEVLEEKDGD